MPKSKRTWKRLEGWLGPAFDRSKLENFEEAFPTPKGWRFVSYELGKLSKNGQQKITRLYEIEFVLTSEGAANLIKKK